LAVTAQDEQNKEIGGNSIFATLFRLLAAGFLFISPHLRESYPSAVQKSKNSTQPVHGITPT
jgi:hypothetical protein